MSETLTLEELRAQAANQHVTAQELDVLVSKTRELTTLRKQEINHLEQLLADLEERLQNQD